MTTIMDDPITRKKNRKLAVDFEKFHAENPQVYATLVRLAREWVLRTGSTKVGIGALYERARWEMVLETSDPNYKLSNNHRAFYARLIMALEPDLSDMFDIKHSAANEWMLAKLDQMGY